MLINCHLCTFFDSVYTACNPSRVTILSFISFMQLYSFIQSESQISLDTDLALHKISFYILYLCLFFSIFIGFNVSTIK